MRKRSLALPVPVVLSSAIFVMTVFAQSDLPSYGGAASDRISDSIMGFFANAFGFFKS